MIQVTNLSKYYGGKHALGPVSFEIADGETIGFLGLNGAGKTTALRILACDLRPSSGTVSVGGTDAINDPHEVRKRIGFLPETPPLYGDMRVDITDLGAVADEVIHTLSHGFRQRVGVAQAIVHAPKFLILDEPTRGLDPVQIVEMRNLIHDLKQNHTVLMSSHILSEISQTCDRLIILGKGKMLGTGSEGELSAKGSEIRQVIVGVRPAKGDPHREPDFKKPLSELLGKLEGVTAVAEPYEQGGALVFALSTTADVRAEASRAVIEAKFDLVKLDYSRSELENTFIRLVGGGDASN
jgi:ABC-2 type transport system ATP-binding protein